MTGQCDTLQIMPDPAELSRMRDFVQHRATENGLDSAAAFRAQLVATEAVTNAMRHGRREGVPIVVRCLAGDEGFTIEVGDRGRFRRRRRPVGAEDTGGRGLGLIERLTRRFDLETSEDGTKLRMFVEHAA